MTSCGPEPAVIDGLPGECEGLHSPGVFLLSFPVPRRHPSAFSAPAGQDSVTDREEEGIRALGRVVSPPTDRPSPELLDRFPSPSASAAANPAGAFMALRIDAP